MPIKPFILFLFAAFLLVHPRPAVPQPPPPGPPPRVEASAQFSFLNTTGNASTESLGTGGDFTWRPDPWTYSAKAAFAQNEADDELSARSLTTLFRASRRINDRLSAFGQYDFLRDIFAGVEQRHIVEGGLSYLAANTPRHRLRFDSGVGYLSERKPDEPFDSAELDLAAAYRLTISETSELTYEPRYLLPFSDTGAWKFDQLAALAVSINSFLSLKVSHTVRYSAKPPLGFETTDTIMAVSLVAKVRRAAN